MAKISELQIRQGNVEVEGTIKEIGETRTFDRFGRQLRVANAILEDDSGTIILTLWNEDIDNYKAGDKVKIINGYVNEFQGEKQLTSGKFGKIEKLGEGEESEDEEVEETDTGESEEVAEEEETEQTEETAEEASDEPPIVEVVEDSEGEEE